MWWSCGIVWNNVLSQFEHENEDDRKFFDETTLRNFVDWSPDFHRYFRCRLSPRVLREDYLKFSCIIHHFNFFRIFFPNMSSKFAHDHYTWYVTFLQWDAHFFLSRDFVLTFVDCLICAVPLDFWLSHCHLKTLQLRRSTQSSVLRCTYRCEIPIHVVILQDMSASSSTRDSNKEILREFQRTFWLEFRSYSLFIRTHVRAFFLARSLRFYFAHGHDPLTFLSLPSFCIYDMIIHVFFESCAICG